MLTEEQFKEAKKLKSRIKFIENFIESRDSENVKTSFCLCDKYVNGNSTSYKIQYHEDDINRFSRENKSFMRDLEDYGFEMLQQELDIIKLEYGKYIK